MSPARTTRLLYPAKILFLTASVPDSNWPHLVQKLLADTGLVLHPILLRSPKVYAPLHCLMQVETELQILLSTVLLRDSNPHLTRPGIEPSTLTLVKVFPEHSTCENRI